ncbi:hypothetical protein HYU40_03110 [Candidatus Woesearchaeota archaeon]|nr:hypothetical protein [Candidatus Woesearchaeota archaeon]
MGKSAIAIVVSAKDIAGMTIKQQLLKSYGFEEVKGETFDSSPIYTLPVEDYEAKLFTAAAEPVRCENIDKRINADILVFATRHASKAGVPALTTHSIGNWGRAELGGRDSTVCPTSPSLLKLFLQNLSAVAKSSGYAGEVVQEATHHGPFVEKPAVFIEVGSTEKEWKDEKLASMVADSLVGGLGDFAAMEENSEKHIPVVALGGLHYGSSFRKLMLETGYAVGHICPKHALSLLTPHLLQQAMAACMPEAKGIVLDWKGLGSEKQRVKELLESSGVEYFKV